MAGGSRKLLRFEKTQRWVGTKTPIYVTCSGARDVVAPLSGVPALVARLSHPVPHITFKFHLDTKSPIGVLVANCELQFCGAAKIGPGSGSHNLNSQFAAAIERYGQLNEGFQMQPQNQKARSVCFFGLCGLSSFSSVTHHDLASYRF